MHGGTHHHSSVVLVYIIKDIIIKTISGFSTWQLHTVAIYVKDFGKSITLPPFNL